MDCEKCKELDAENARLRAALEMAAQQIEYLLGKRKRGWDGYFLRKTLEAALAVKPR
jgi:hypothetical protein